jgi:vanillate O-demethylase ferredoxin subunit
MQRAWISLMVSRKRVEAEGVYSFELVNTDNANLPPFSAGSHIAVEIAPGLVRQYSLCNSPAERHRYLIGVLREPRSRGGSIAMIERIVEGSRVRTSEPRNHFELAPDAKRVLLFAGGIGVTPILCMAERLAHSSTAFRVYYANRSRSRAAFLERLRESPLAAHVHLHFDDEAGGPLDLRATIGPPDSGSHLYVCGPGGYIKAVLDEATRNGWLSHQVHREYFVPAPDTMTAAPGSFSVRVASTGETYVIPADRLVIDVLAEHGIRIPVSCQQGVCGTCVTRVLEGVPEHNDLFMTDEEHAKNDQFTPCCSRSKTAYLVLDL